MGATTPNRRPPSLSTLGNVPVRVLWVVKGLGPGGAERLLCAAAHAHDRDRFHIECAFVLPYKDHLADDLERAGVATHCLSRTRTDLRWPLRLLELVRHGGWDIVHVHSPLPGSVARLAARVTPRSDRPMLVSTEHNRWTTHRRPTRWLNAATSRWDDVSIAVTNEVRESMGDRAMNRTQVLQHGIDLDATTTASAARDDVRREFGLGDDEFVVGTVANFRAQKDYPNLFAAARLLADRHVPVRFIAVGQGPQEAETRQLAADLGLGDQMILTGFRDDAVRVMGACDVFALASKWEGLPVALMEALALGLPVVATDVGGIAEEMVDGDTALLVQPSDAAALANAIERIVVDPELRARLVAGAGRKAPDFDARRAVRRIEHIYAELAPADSLLASEPTPTTTPRRLPQGLEIRAATPLDRPAILELCRASLGWGDDPRFEELFSWKHDQNSFGPSYMWVAVDSAKVVGLRAFMRWEFVRGGEVLRAVRAVDTATHPDYQGKGLFTAMTMHGLDVIADDGVDFVFNTPNAKSRPGYLKMRWQEIGKLRVAIKLASGGAAIPVARSRVAASHWPLPLDIGEPIEAFLGRHTIGPVESTDPRTLVTNRSNEFARWRYGAPLLGARVVDVDGSPVVVRTRRRGRSVEFVLLDRLGGSPPTSGPSAELIAGVHATHALRLGTAQPCAGWLPAPGGGPVLTFRSAHAHAAPALQNWNLTMGDVELF
jgi:L-malate glycosyltransferase